MSATICTVYSFARKVQLQFLQLQKVSFSISLLLWWWVAGGESHSTSSTTRAEKDLIKTSKKIRVQKYCLQQQSYWSSFITNYLAVRAVKGLCTKGLNLKSKFLLISHSTLAYRLVIALQMSEHFFQRNRSWFSFYQKIRL